MGGRGHFPVVDGGTSVGHRPSQQVPLRLGATATLRQQQDIASRRVEHGGIGKQRRMVPSPPL